MEKKNVLEIMAHVDFSNPISTKIIFEDDDDDEFVMQNIHNENNKRKSLDKTCCSIDINYQQPEENCKVNDLDTVTVISAFQFNSPKKKISLKSNEYNQKCRNDKKAQYNQASQITKATDKASNQNSYSENIHNPAQSALEKTYDTDAYTVSSQNPLKTLQQLLSLQQPVEANTSHLNSKRPHSNNENSTTYKKLCSGQNNNAKSLNFTESTNSQNFVDGNLPKMIKLISEHLVHILQYEKFYTRNGHHLTENKDKIEKKKAAAKYHYFKLSYSTILTVFLEKEQNEPFVRNFIENTLKLCNSMGLPTTFNEVAILYSEMLTWTKQEQYHISKTQHYIFEMNNNRLNTSATTEPPAYGTSCNQPIPQSNLPPPVSQFQSPQSEHQDLHQTSNRQPLTPNQNYSQLPSYEQTANLQQSRLPQLPTYQQVFQMNLHSSMQTMPEKQSWQTSLRTAGQLNHPSNSTTQDRQSLAPILQDQLLARNTRSISRDSGIASPSLNADTTRGYQEDNQSLYQPVITQVHSEYQTYMTPQRKKVTGECSVCKKNTTKMCLGCYSIYYCSIDCQKIHYRQHVSSCKLRTK